MSVTSHTAAKRRTAVGTRGRRSRARLIASWLFILPTLAFFSFTVVAGASTFGSPDYASAVGDLGTDDPVVAVESDSGGGLFGSKQTVICSVTQSQLTQISSRYRTGKIVVGSTIVITVYGATEKGLRSYLDAHVKCQLVESKKVFYLPFDAHGS
jgi:hypothetical protein